VAARLRKRVNDLSFFSLSVLSRMPPSERREKYLREFSDNPFTTPGIRTLVHEMLAPSHPEIRVEAASFDIRNNVCEPALTDLCAVRLDARGGADMITGRHPFMKGDTVLVLPSRLAGPEALVGLAPADGPSAVLDRLKAKYGSLPEFIAAVIQYL
jgi:hypothetical protein